MIIVFFPALSTGAGEKEVSHDDTEGMQGVGAGGACSSLPPNKL